MGYRSDVRIIMSKNGFEELKKQVNEHISNYKKLNVTKGAIRDMYDFNLLNHLDVHKQAIDDKNKIYFGWNALKWYDGYEDVDAIMDSLDKLKEKGYGYSYARIGEDFTDYEERYANTSMRDNINFLEVPPVERYFADGRYRDTNLIKNNKNERDDR